MAYSSSSSEWTAMPPSSQSTVRDNNDSQELSSQDSVFDGLSLRVNGGSAASQDPMSGSDPVPNRLTPIPAALLEGVITATYVGDRLDYYYLDFRELKRIVEAYQDAEMLRNPLCTFER